MNTDQNFLVKNLQNMCDYIRQETDKKAALIKKEAIKDAELEKSKMVKPEQEKIKSKMNKDLEEYRIQVKIDQSKAANKLRLQKLKCKIEFVDEIIKETKVQLVNKITKDPNEYKKVLKNLIVQGLIKLLEENVVIVCKKNEVSIIESVLETAIKEFEEILHRESKKYSNFVSKVTIDNKKFIPEDRIGGITLLALKSKIMVDNTLDKRLDLLKQSATPEIRKLLFKNSN